MHTIHVFQAGRDYFIDGIYWGDDEEDVMMYLRAVPSWIYYTYPQWANHPLASCAVIISKASVMA